MKLWSWNDRRRRQNRYAQGLAPFSLKDAPSFIERAISGRAALGGGL